MKQEQKIVLDELKGLFQQLNTVLQKYGKNVQKDPEMAALIQEAQTLKKQALDPAANEAEPVAVGKAMDGEAEMGGCSQLKADLDILIKDLDALEGQLNNLAITSIKQANVIGSAYALAFKNFNETVDDMHKLNADLNAIAVSVLTVFSVGAFAWVSNFSTRLSKVKDAGSVFVDKATGHALSGDLKASAKLVDPLVFNNLKMNEMLDVVIQTLNVCSGLKSQCTADHKSLHEGCKNYAEIYKRYKTDKGQATINTFFENSTKEIAAVLASVQIPIASETLTQHFEYGMWVTWIPSLESIKTTYPKPHGMGPYAGRTPNYPTPGKKEKPEEKPSDAPKTTVLYDGWLARTVRDRLRGLGIDKKAGVNLDFEMMGFGGVDDDEIEKLVKWARAQKITF